MKDEQPKEVLLIYLPAIVHWFGAYTTIGLLYVLFNIPMLVVVLLCMLGLLVLPPIFRIVKKEDLDKEDKDE
jgi:hypothetical protein